MPNILQTDLNRDLTIFEISDPLLFDDLVLTVKHFFEGRDNPVTHNVLFDFRKATVDHFTLGEVEDLAIFASSADTRKGLSKTAIVVEGDQIYSLAKFYQSNRSKPSLRFEVFHTMDEASGWLEEKWH